MAEWRVVTDDMKPHAYWVALVEGVQRLHVHPIGFTMESEAERAAARLNLRDAGITGEPVPVPPEDEARAARQSRLAELRAKRDARERS